jgi:predicted amidohydrolase YtcJ
MSRIRAEILLILGAAAIVQAQQTAPDVILLNGKIVTVDDRFTIAQAMAIQGDRIQAVGTTAEINRLAGPATRRIDLQGRTVTPGLIDNHIHALREATTWTRELRFDGVESRKQALAMIQARVKTAGPGEWIYNIGGWTHWQFTDDARSFTRQELDEIAPSNPVALQESYYQVILNSRALDALGINAHAPDPEGFVKGSIDRDPAGMPTGIVKGDIAGTRAVASRLPRVRPDQLEASSLAMVKELNRVGLTSVGVPGCDSDVLEIFQKLKTQGELNLRTFCIVGAAAANPEQVDRVVQQIRQMKLFQGDGFIDDISFGESVYSPLHDPMFALESHPGPDQLAAWRRIALAVAEAGLPLHVHAELRNTIDPFLDQIESINHEHPIHNLRWALAHVNQINPSQLERMKKLGMYAAVHPWAVINGGIMHEGFGDSASDMPPLRAIQDSGIIWGFGTDGTAANTYLPFTLLSFAVTGKMAGGTRVLRQTVSREDALIAYTRRNAWFVFQEDNLGSLQPGKAADLIVLDRDYLTIPVDQIRYIHPMMTMVAGRTVYDATGAKGSR